jgi:hypothetical protein
MKAILSFLIVGILISAGSPGWSQQKAPSPVPTPDLPTYLVAAWSDTPEALNKFSTNIKSIALSGSETRYIDGRSQWLVLFLVEPGDKILDLPSFFGDDREFLSATKMLVDKIIVRTYLTLDYETGVSTLNRQSVKFWIGDSAPRPFPQLSKSDSSDVNTFVPDFESCKNVTPGCIRSLISQGYLSQNTVVEGQSVNPLHYLENSFKDSMELRQDNVDVGTFRIRSPVASFKSVISDVVLSHQVWIYLNPSSEVIKISTFSDLTGNKIVDFNTPNFPLLRTPLLLDSQHIATQVRLNPNEMKTLTGSLYDVSFKTQYILKK